jgi:hypothetical protein
VLSVKEFIEDPSRDKFLAAILAMRQDLWTRGSDLTIHYIALGKDAA